MKQSTHPALLSNEKSSWHIGRRMVSLKDVQKYSAARLAGISRCLTSIGITVSVTMDETSKPHIEDCLKTIIEECQGINLNMTRMGAERLLQEMSRISEDKMAGELDVLQRRFDDEIQSVVFFMANPEMLKYYDNSELAGQQFKANFPTVGNGELIEAGNCLTHGRHTACVCHLMRALDVVLTQLEKHLAIVPPQSGAGRTWGLTLNRIKTQIEANDKSVAPPNNWSTDREFYIQAEAFLRGIKNAFRDATMHVKASYDEQSAMNVFQVTTVALRHLATKLAE